MLQFEPQDRATAQARFLAAMELERLDDLRFIAQVGEGGRRIFGGQLAAQALLAASQTLPDAAQDNADPRRAHSMHGYFFLPGRPEPHLEIAVDRIRDGRSFSARRASVWQSGRRIFELTASFALAQPGPEHGESAPSVPPPENCGDREQKRHELFGREWLEQAINAVEIRLTQPELLDPPPGTRPYQANWVRFPLATEATRTDLHDAMLLFASDRGLLTTAALPHGLRWGRPAGASLDHALWIHRPVDLSAWHLFVMQSPRATAGRALLQTAIYTASGDRVASACQEALLRPV
jgi:acyl-CoA thioesterase-2